MNDAAKQKQVRARSQTRKAVEAAARSRTTLTYTEVTEKIDALRLAPNSKVLAAFLCEISRGTETQRHALLSAVVVRADSGIPGSGFFKLAEQLGRDVSDERACWETEIAKVYAAWTPAHVSR